MGAESRDVVSSERPRRLPDTRNFATRTAAASPCCEDSPTFTRGKNRLAGLRTKSPHSQGAERSLTDEATIAESPCLRDCQRRSREWRRFYGRPPVARHDPIRAGREPRQETSQQRPPYGALSADIELVIPRACFQRRKFCSLPVSGQRRASPRRWKEPSRLSPLPSWQEVFVSAAA